MSIFGNILDKLGFDRRGGQAASSATTRTPPPRQTSPASKTGGQPQSRSTSTAPATPGGSAGAPPAATAAAPAGATPMSEVDVMGKLEKMAAENPQKLNWRTSIVDLLKLLGLDSSLAARKELATELGCPPEKMADSAQMNTWLHKTVLQKLAQSGGNVPQELLH